MRYRIRTNEYIVERLDRLGIPVVKPAGGHAVFIDAREWLPHIKPTAYPGQAVAVGLYELGGIRSCEIGTVMFGMQPDGTEKIAQMDLVRLAMPRRTYTQSHADYIIEIFEDLAKINAAFYLSLQTIDDAPWHKLNASIAPTPVNRAI